MRAHEQSLVQAADRELEVRFARSPADQRAAVALLDDAERAVGAPLVDEAERARLDQIDEHDAAPVDEHDAHQHWHPLLAWQRSTGLPVGYAGLVLPPARAATGDLVLHPTAPHGTGAALAQATGDLAAKHDAPGLTLWLRHAGHATVAGAGHRGWEVTRRLHVLGRELERTSPAVELPAGLTLDRDGASDEEIARLLRRAYRDTPDGEWDADDVARRRAMSWFRAQDLFVARRDGDLVGLHWTKRRDAATGEVYNLAIDPEAQGLGLGAALLDLGLAHLAEVGLRRAVLWVDHENVAGLALYASRGFERLWDDVALSRGSTEQITGRAAGQVPGQATAREHPRGRNG